ncbi:XrtA/PEP-CTERM system histidine kinase PrsK [Echinimonas agarilytica]|uniref:histidine kinase n=1 Tax=Echinimonas agarilytica TaxID=1215918 RepID=A0AA42B8W5_9GAMM|nr:XrtA/PEP-CTERM system histidine kinase PrsK [Echinimonas agarilytica]MCM2681459.1 PEP-CTERM system histidine kinase PrsK [Echinimonas agarilytica]
MSETIGFLGYAFSATSYAFLFLLLLTTRQPTPQRTALIVTSVIGVVWGVILTLQIYQGSAMGMALAADSLRNICWIVLLNVALSNESNFRHLLNSPQKMAVALILAATVILDFTMLRLKWFDSSTLLLLHLGQCVLALWMLEHLYRRTDIEARWTIKPICLGLGMIYVFDFVLYSNAMLTKSLSLDFWYLRGWVNALALPLILLTARRVQDWSTRIFVSREVIFHSTLLLAAGGYLLVMALAGYYIRYVGGAWGNMAQLVFFVLGGLVLASLFLSDKLRRNVKVFIAKHFFANKYEYREEWMKFAAVLEEGDGTPYEVALKAMVKPFSCKHAVLAIQEGKQFKIVASRNEEDFDGEAKFLLEQLGAQATNHDWVIDIKETRAGEGKLPFEFPPDALGHIKRYAYIVPLTSKVGVNGVCLLSSPSSTESVDWEDRDLMKVISRQLSVHLKLHHTNIQLAENQQFDTFNRMSAFLVHDLKNVLAQLELLSKNAIKHKHNPEFVEDAFETVDAAATRLNKVLSQLRQKRAEGEVTQYVDVLAVVQNVLTSCSNRTPAATLKNSVPFSIHTSRERFENVLTHLIQNAQEATSNEGKVTVSTATDDDCYTISITDTGSGMTDDFIKKRLFKPFDTTKGNAGMGIGAYDARKFVEQLGGNLDVTSVLGEGSRFELKLPIHND